MGPINKQKSSACTPAARYYYGTWYYATAELLAGQRTNNKTFVIILDRAVGHSSWHDNRRVFAAHRRSRKRKEDVGMDPPVAAKRKEGKRRAKRKTSLLLDSYSGFGAPAQLQGSNLHK